MTLSLRFRLRYQRPRDRYVYMYVSDFGDAERRVANVLYIKGILDTRRAVQVFRIEQLRSWDSQFQTDSLLRDQRKPWAARESRMLDGRRPISSVTNSITHGVGNTEEPNQT